MAEKKTGRPKLEDRKALTELEHKYCRLRIQDGMNIAQACQELNLKEVEMARRERIFIPLRQEMKRLREDKLGITDDEEMGFLSYRIKLNIRDEVQDLLSMGSLDIDKLQKAVELLHVLDSDIEAEEKRLEVEASREQQDWQKEKKSLLLAFWKLLGEGVKDDEKDAQKWREKYFNLCKELESEEVDKKKISSNQWAEAQAIIGELEAENAKFRTQQHWIEVLNHDGKGESRLRGSFKKELKVCEEKVKEQPRPRPRRRLYSPLTRGKQGLN